MLLSNTSIQVLPQRMRDTREGRHLPIMCQTVMNVTVHAMMDGEVIEQRAT